MREETKQTSCQFKNKGNHHRKIAAKEEGKISGKQKNRAKPRREKGKKRAVSVWGGFLRKKKPMGVQR